MSWACILQQPVPAPFHSATSAGLPLHACAGWQSLDLRTQGCCAGVQLPVAVQAERGARRHGQEAAALHRGRAARQPRALHRQPHPRHELSGRGAAAAHAGLGAQCAMGDAPCGHASWRAPMRREARGAAGVGAGGGEPAAALLLLRHAPPGAWPLPRLRQGPLLCSRAEALARCRAT